MKKQVILYDFDGTIYRKDSFKTFIIHCIPIYKLILSSATIFIYILKMKLGKITNEQCKEAIFSYFFEGTTKVNFDLFCTSFAEKIKKNASQILLSKIKENSKYTQVIVSASIYNWIAPWSNSMGIDKVIATEIQISNQDIISGKFTTKNCNSHEKVNRLNEIFNTDEYEIIEAYGNSKDDYPMFSLAQSAFLIKHNSIIQMK